jgi:hypothetical protein
MLNIIVPDVIFLTEGEDGGSYCILPIQVKVHLNKKINLYSCGGRFQEKRKIITVTN